MRKVSSKILAKQGGITIELAAYVMWCENCGKYHVGIAMPVDSPHGSGIFPQFSEVLEEDFDDEIIASMAGTAVLEMVYDGIKDKLKEVMPVLLEMIQLADKTAEEEEQESLFNPVNPVSFSVN